jgi:hypothetical protein
MVYPKGGTDSNMADLYAVLDVPKTATNKEVCNLRISM